MNDDTKNVTPVRQMSDRRSKPSIDRLIDGPRRSKPPVDILVDNLRIILPNLKDVVKHNSITKSSDSNSESSSFSSKVKIRRESLRGRNTPDQSSIQSAKNITKKRIITSKTVSHKRKIKSPIINGLENDHSLSEVNYNILSNLPYVTLRLNKIEIKDFLKIEDADTENDDLPLSKEFSAFNESMKPDNCVVPSKCKSKTIRKVSPNVNQSPPPKSNTPLPSIKAIKTSPTVANDLSKLPSPLAQRLSSPVKTKKKKSRIPNGADSEAALESNDSKCEISLPTLIERPPQCVRAMCTNVAIADFRWDKEFCSPDCALLHAKSMFRDMIISKKSQSQTQI